MNTRATDAAEALVARFLLEASPEVLALPLKDAIVQLTELAQAAQAAEAQTCADLLVMSDDSIRLQAGEIDSDEMLTVQALLKWRARVIRGRHVTG